MEPIVIVTCLALMQYFLFGLQVGQMRGKHGVRAPAMAGHPEFERAFRVHENTLEQLIVFVPVLWMYGYFVHPVWGAGLGLVFIISRFMYRAAYMKDPAKRGPGFTLGFLANVVMILWVLVVAVMGLAG
jgi:uncharacterized membrane protein YecN with MAPEG domain